MKNYEEMAESLFERREKYSLTRAKRLKKTKAAAAALSCLCLAAFCGFGLFGNRKPVEPKIEEPSNIININFGNALSQAPESDTTDISGIKSIDANMQDLVKNFAPKLPDDLKINCGYVVYSADRTAGEAPTYCTSFSSASDAARNVNIEVCKGDEFPASDENEKFEKSIIKGKTVYIALNDSGKYYAVFQSDDIGFRITAEGLTQDELIRIIKSLI